MFQRLDVRVVRVGVILSLAAAVAPLQLRASSDLQHHLQDQYKDKSFVLRDFNQGARLTYDAAGNPTGQADPGDWTVAGFVRITGVDVSDRRLTIKAERLYLEVAKGVGFQLALPDAKDKKSKEARNLRLEVALDAGGLSRAKADAVLSKVFLTAADRLVGLVPDYWKLCVRAASTGIAAKGVTDCRFAPDLATIPGVMYRAEDSAEFKAPDSTVPALDEEIVPEIRRGNGILPPKIISQNSPEFSEEARQAKYQGNVSLRVIVEKTGRPQRATIMHPAGMGLDQRAVQSVSQWRFQPGSKDGQPLAVSMAVDVSFRLY